MTGAHIPACARRCCVIEGCPETEHIRKHQLCKKHYSDWWMERRGGRAVYLREWRAKNPEKVEGYRERKPDHPCTRCGITIPGRRPKYCEGCAEEVLLEYNRERGRRYRLASEERRISDMVRARARKEAQRNTDLTPAFLVQLKDEAPKCPLCDVELTAWPGHSNSREVDHIIPLNVGGTHTIGNVRVICRSCNLKRPKDGSDLVDHQPTLWAVAA